MALTGTEQHRWWKEAAIYQIYPSSFKDSNGDGWGDLKGIISKVDYLKELGVDIIWISPIYKSPQADMGYDISDYKLIDPIYGTNEDVDVLIAELKKRDMKLMMDLVVNHTSNEHSWFLESRSSKDNPKRNWYIWKAPKGRTASGAPIPPNNWCQILAEGESAWTYDEKTDEYYLSIFTSYQPDLNWENEEMRAAVHDLMAYWLERGVCGYRMDVINLISKDPAFPDAPITLEDHEFQPGHQYYVNGPHFHEYMQELNQKVLSKYQAVTVGEMPGVSDVGEILRTVGSKAGELSMIFIFDIVDIDIIPGKAKYTLHPWTAKDLTRILAKWQRAMIDFDGWNTIFVENHDQPRSVSRYTDDSDEMRTKGAKLLCIMQTTLAGTVYVYQGEELGMRNFPTSWDLDSGDYKDVEALMCWRNAKQIYANDPVKLAEVRRALQHKARDHARTPMQWDAGPNAGFCAEGVTPWMRVNDDYREINAAAQLEAKDGEPSVLRFWQRCLASRRAHKEVFVYGDFQLLGPESDQVFAYLRSGDSGAKALVLLNFSGKRASWTIDSSLAEVVAWVVGNYPDFMHKQVAGEIMLEPWEGLLGRCKGTK